MHNWKSEQFISCYLRVRSLAFRCTSEFRAELARKVSYSTVDLHYSRFTLDNRFSAR